MLIPPELSRLTGEERFVGINATVLDFWRWAFGDLRMNTNRGVLAEFLVAVAVGVTARPKVEWADCDLHAPNGCRIEVKAAGFLHSWPHRRLTPGRIRYTGLTARPWSVTEGLGATRIHKADLYVFALQAETDHAKYGPLDVSQWKFIVFPVSTVASWGRRSVSLAWLEAQGVPWVRWGQLGAVIDREAAAFAVDKTERSANGAS